MRITGDERLVIKLLAHSVFSVEFVEKWQHGSGNGSKPAILQAEFNGFMSAVRSLSNPNVQHAIYRKIDVDNKIEDIRLRMEELFQDQNISPRILKLRDDSDFLQHVYSRWDKMLGWVDIGDVYWETCDDAIKEILETRHILLTDAG